MTEKRIDRAIEIINYAIQNQITVTEASVKCGFAYTYVKNVKALVYEEYDKDILSDELFNKFVEAYERYEKGDIEFDKENTKPQVNVNVDTTQMPAELRKIPQGEKTEFKNEDDDNEATVSWTWNQNYPPDHVKTVPELLKACDVDTNIWRVKEQLVNKWDTSFKVNDAPLTIQNWQVKARLERDVKLSEALDIEKIFTRMAQNYQPPVLDWTPIKPTTAEENNLLEISIFDLHMGKLAWGGETGENYDTKIARERFLSSIEKLLHRAIGFPFSRILFPVGNDFFNSDTIFNTTTQGTPQDEDLRWQKTFNVGVRLLIDGINLLKQTGVPVDVVVIPGNHDFERSFYMGKYLEAWFNNDPQVNINCGASPRKYYHFGNVLLGLTHGSEEKEASLPMIMATDIESKPLWSITKFHEWHLGHIHRKRNINYSTMDVKHRTLSEDLGVTIRYLSSLTGTEEWHHKKGFIGQIKAADAFIWNYEFGLIAHLNSNLIID